MSSNDRAREVFDFWVEAGPAKWFQQDDAFDAKMVKQFAKLHEEAAAGKCDDWIEDPQDCLSLIIILDQFSRNMFRKKPKAFAQDAKALSISETAIGRSYDMKVAKGLRTFFYMPFMHSEQLADQQRSVSLQHSIGEPNGVRYAIIHLEIIERFGRFPHRNPVLGRH